MSAITVTVRSSDLISDRALAGYVQQHPQMVLVPYGNAGRADVVVLSVEDADEAMMATLQELRDSLGAKVLLIVGGQWYADFNAALDFGVRAALFRSEFTWPKFGEALLSISRGHGVFPASLQGALMDHVQQTYREVLVPRGLTPTGLATRDVDVLRLVAEGYELKAVGAKLGYSERTVKNILYSLIKRFNMRNRVHMVSYAIRRGLI